MDSIHGHNSLSIATTEDDLRHTVSGTARSTATILENLTSAFITFDSEWHISYLSHVAEQLEKGTSEALIGKSLWEVFSDEAALNIYRHAQEAIQSRTTVQFEAYCSLSNRWFGAQIYLSHNGTALHLQDITQRKQAEKAQSHLAAIVESSNDPIIAATINGTITNWNASAERAYGYSAEEAIGKSIYLIVPPDKIDEVASITEKLRQGQQIEQLETARLCKDGHTIDISLTISPIKDTTGQIIGSSAISRNITEQKRAEQKLQESENRFRALIEKSSDSIIVADAEGKALYLSPSAIHSLPYELDKKRDFDAFDIIHPDDHETVKNMVAEMLKQPGKSFSGQVRWRHKDGSWRWMEGISRNLLNDPSVRGIVTNYRDITERKQAEERILNSERQLQVAFETAHLGIWQRDLATDMLTCSAQWNANLGLSADTVPTYAAFQETILPEDRETIRQAVKKAIEERVTYQAEYRARWPDGSTHWITSRGYCLYDEDDKPSRLIGITLDITKNKELERRKDTFISMASHELKTPLTSLKIFASLLQRRLKQRDDEQSLQYLTKMEKQLNKLTTLTSDLLDISKIQTGKFILREEVFDIVKTAREVIDHLSETTSTHTLYLDCPVDSIPIFGDKDRIEQVLINLLTNAIKYSPNADKVMIAVSTDQQDALVRIQDFGIGINDVHQQHIFECFYQVAEPGEKTFPGLGMGLYITNEIIQQHHGRIWIESTEGVGSIFSFTLPLRPCTNAPDLPGG